MSLFRKLVDRHSKQYSEAFIYTIFTILGLVVAVVLFSFLHSTGIMKLVFPGVVQSAEFGGAFTGFFVTLFLLIRSYRQASKVEILAITGNVLSNDGTPIKGAMVFVEGVDRQKETDLSGWFQIEVSDQEIWTIRAHYGGQVAEAKVRRKNIYRPVRLVLSKSLKETVDLDQELNLPVHDEFSEPVHPQTTADQRPFSGITIENGIKMDWRQAKKLPVFFGRRDEVSQLKKWIVQDQCRVVVVVGIGAVGKSSLVARVGAEIKQDFEYCFWRELNNAPPVEDILSDAIKFFSDQRSTDLPLDDIQACISLLLQYMRDKRCLFVLDNAETILQIGEKAGHYRPGYEQYGKLIEQLGHTPHRSCLVLTSREKPQGVDLLVAASSPIRMMQIGGLDVNASQQLLEWKGLLGNEDSKSVLIDLYRGHPLALQIVAVRIEDLYSRSVDAFLGEEQLIAFGDISDLLAEQFRRLSVLEKEVMYWLAIERELVSCDYIKNNILHFLSRTELLEILASLRRRSLVEKSELDMVFTLQPVVMEWVTEQLVVSVVGELSSASLDLVDKHALMKAQAKEYVRATQAELIVKPVVERLKAAFGVSALRNQLMEIIALLRNSGDQSRGYAAGNIVNILVEMGVDVTGYDFSSLYIRQAYLQGVNLNNVSFALSSLEFCAFTQTFGNVLSVAFSPAGDLLATGTSTGEIWIWNVESGKLIRTLKGHTDWIRSVAFSPNGFLLASGSNDETVRIWDLSAGENIAVLQGHTSRVRSVVFNPAGGFLASGSDDTTVRIWDIKTGACLDILKGHESAIWSIAYGPHGRLLVSGSDDRTVRLWEVATENCIRIWKGHTNSVKAVCFSSDGQWIASGSEDQTTRLWSIDQEQAVQILRGHSGTVWATAITHDSNLIASGSEDHTIRLWNRISGECLNTLQGHGNLVWSVAFSPDGRLLASSSDDQTVRLWDIDSRRTLRTFQGYTNLLRSLALSPDGHTLAVAGDDMIIRILSAKTGEVIASLRQHTNRVRSVVFTHNGQRLASASDDCTVRLWNLTSGQCTRTLTGHQRRVWSVDYCAQRNLLASGSEDNTIMLWDATSGENLDRLEGHESWIWSVAFSPDGRFLATASEDQTARLWDIDERKQIAVFSGHEGWLFGAAFSPDGKCIVTGSGDKSARIWDVETQTCLAVLQGHTGWIWSASFSPDGLTLATGSEDTTIRLWRVDTGECTGVLEGHSAWVVSVLFSLDGQVLYSASADETVRVWDPNSGECAAIMHGTRPYEGMNITGVKGLVAVEKESLRLLGAVEE